LVSQVRKQRAHTGLRHLRLPRIQFIFGSAVFQRNRVQAHYLNRVISASQPWKRCARSNDSVITGIKQREQRHY